MRLLIASDAHGDANATRLLRESYAIERPDVVVHLGDMVDGQTANASTSLRALLAAAPGQRWLILGNHDEEALPASEILRIAGQPRASLKTRKSRSERSAVIAPPPDGGFPLRNPGGAHASSITESTTTNASKLLSV